LGESVPCCTALRTAFLGGRIACCPCCTTSEGTAVREDAGRNMLPKVFGHEEAGREEAKCRGGAKGPHRVRRLDPRVRERSSEPLRVPELRPEPRDLRNMLELLRKKDVPRCL
jgi:hypothetical protein